MIRRGKIVSNVMRITINKSGCEETNIYEIFEIRAKEVANMGLRVNRFKLIAFN